MGIILCKDSDFAKTEKRKSFLSGRFEDFKLEGKEFETKTRTPEDLAYVKMHSITALLMLNRIKSLL